MDLSLLFSHKIIYLKIISFLDSLKNVSVTLRYVTQGKNFYYSFLSFILMRKSRIYITLESHFIYTLKGRCEKSSLSITRSFISQLLSDRILCTANGAEVIRMSTFNFTFYLYQILCHYRVFVHAHTFCDNLIQKLAALEFSIMCNRYYKSVKSNFR